MLLTVLLYALSSFLRGHFNLWEIRRHFGMLEETPPPLRVDTNFEDHEPSQSSLGESGIFVARGMESIVGDIVGEYPGRFENCEGTFYAGTKGVYFLGSFFLFERKVVLYWDQVQLVQKIRQGIEVVSKQQDGEIEAAVHQFHGIHAPDRVWALLVSLHNDAILLKQGKRGTPRAGSMVRRRNSDPWNLACSLEDLLEGQEGDDGTVTSTFTTSTAMHSWKPSNSSEWMANETRKEEIIAAAGPLRMEPIQCNTTKDHTFGWLYVGEDAIFFRGRRFLVERKSATFPWESIERIEMVDATPKTSDCEKNCNGIRIVDTFGNASSFRLPKVDIHTIWSSILAIQNENLQSRSLKQHRRTNSDPLRPTPQLDAVDFNDQSLLSRSNHVPIEKTSFSVVVQQSSTAYTDVVVKDHVLHCDMDRFYELFVVDDAPYSLATYMEGRGDREMISAPWEGKVENAQSRTVTFVHPVSVPMAPAQAAARKEQVLRRFGSDGMILETRTHVTDVPMTDCFYVADRMIVKTLPGVSSQVTVTSEFGIVYVKSTYFKSILNKSITSEYNTFFREWTAFMSKAVGRDSNRPRTKSESDVKTTADTFPERKPVESPSQQQILVPLLVMMCVSQLWLLFEVRSMKTTIRSMEARNR